MIRIAQILNKMDNGGIETTVINYYRHIDRSKVQFDFYYNEESLMPHYQELKDMGAGLYPMPSYKHVIKYIMYLIKKFKENRYNIVHSQVNTMSVFSLIAAKIAGVRVRICHAHAMGSKKEGLRYILKIFLRPLNLLFATSLFACGDDSGKWMFKNRDFICIPNAVDTEKFAFSNDKRIQIRRKLGIPLDAFVVGHVGRYTIEKNHDFLLKIHSEIPESYLLLIGDVPKTLATSRVICAGSYSDISDFYSAMDVFCMPSFSEGFPVSLVEAQVNGLRCLCSNAVTRQADLGATEYLPIDNPKTWAQKCVESKRAICSISDEFDIGKAAERLQKWYMENYDYVSVYVRNIDEGPACYYRLGQYVQNNWKINNAYSRRQYRRNFDMPGGALRKIYQAYLLCITIKNRILSLNYDLKYHPKYVVIQRELVPKVMPKVVYTKLKKLEHVVWDFDDDIRAENECSKREFEWLKKTSETIVVTNSYLNEMVDNRAIILPTTQKPVQPKKKNNYPLRVLWLGSFSNLPNLDMVGDIPEGMKLVVVCNKPYAGAENVIWTRERAEEELSKADIGIMPLADKPYNYGKGGFKIIQYMSAALPVVASPIGMNKDIVSSNFGYLTNNFKDALSELASNDSRRITMGENAFKAYNEKFSYEFNLSKWKKILE